MAFNVSYIYTLKDKFTPIANKIKTSTDNIGSSFKGLQDRAKKLSDRLDKIGKNLSLKVTAPIVASGTAAALMFGKFEEGLGNTLTLLDSTAPEGFSKRLEKVAKSGIKAGYGIEDSTKALFDSVSALGAGDAAIQAFETAQILARGGAASLSVSVDGLTSVMNAYGKETTKASDVANAFFSAQKGGKTTVEALASNVGKVAPVAKAAGVEFKTLLATMAQLTLGGLSTEMASTGLRGAINSLTKPSKEAEKVMQQYGIASNATELQSQGLLKTLEKLSVLAKKNPNLIAQMIPEVEARTAIAALGEKEIGNLKNIIAGINNDISKGTGLTDAFAKKNAEMNATVARAAGNLKIMAITAGAIMAPAISKVANIIGIVSQKFTQFAQQNPKLAKLSLVLIGMVAVAGPLIVAAGMLASMFAAFSAAAAIVAAKIALVATAIAALIVFWDDLMQGMQNVLEFWEGGFLNGIKTVASAISDLISSLSEFLFGSNELNVNANIQGPGVASRTLVNNARIDGQINVNAPPGVVRSVESRQTGAVIGDLGMGLAG